MNKISWIDTIQYDQADQQLKDIYDAVRSPGGNLDNLYQAFSLRAHTIQPADDLYQAALHHPNNSLPKWYAEFVSTFCAILAGCEYAQTHHGHNFVHLLGDQDRADSMLQNLRGNQLELCGDAKEVSGLHYVRKLCLEPENMSASDVTLLSNDGWDHGEILELVQITAMFSYFVRVINAVGISLSGDRVGLY